MMRRARRFGYSDPFRLSTIGRLRAGVAWLRGPATLTRWLLIVMTVCAILTLAAAVTGSVMQAASPNPPATSTTAAKGRPQSQDLKELLRAGPSQSNVVDRPGYECRPMPDRRVLYFNPFNSGPTVVVIDRDGVVWGPACLVSAGIAGV